MNKQEVIGKYKLGQKVAIYGYLWDLVDLYREENEKEGE